MDYRQIPQSEYPFIVFADHNYGMIASWIKRRTKSNYSHMMFMLAPGVLASQGFATYSKVPIEKYMLLGNRLKYVGLNGISEQGRKQLTASIEAKLKGPFYRKLYDWIGIFGQVTGLTWIQTPGFEYCSEDVAYHLQKTEIEYPIQFTAALSSAIRALPENASPGMHDKYSKNHRDVFPLLGKWSGDED